MLVEDYGMLECYELHLYHSMSKADKGVGAIVEDGGAVRHDARG